MNRPMLRVVKKPEAKPDKQEEFMNLYEPVHERLSRFVHSMVWNREDARDIIADTVLKAYENFEKLEKKEAFLYFLFGIASNVTRHRNRRMKFWASYDKEHYENNLVDDSYDVYRKMEVDVLYKAMGRLPEKQREALSLFEISGFSIAEIRQIQGGSLSGVKSRLVRARQELASMLKTEYKISHQMRLETSY
jgi:RNA polymerase sigma-70 factor (ECF subfamily)